MEFVAQGFGEPDTNQLPVDVVPAVRLSTVTVGGKSPAGTNRTASAQTLNAELGAAWTVTLAVPVKV